MGWSPCIRPEPQSTSLFVQPPWVCTAALHLAMAFVHQIHATSLIPCHCHLRRPAHMQLLTHTAHVLQLFRVQTYMHTLTHTAHAPQLFGCKNLHGNEMQRHCKVAHLSSNVMPVPGQSQAASLSTLRSRSWTRRRCARASGRRWSATRRPAPPSCRPTSCPEPPALRGQPSSRSEAVPSSQRCRGQAVATEATVSSGRCRGRARA